MIFSPPLINELSLYNNIVLIHNLHSLFNILWQILTSIVHSKLFNMLLFIFSHKASVLTPGTHTAMKKYCFCSVYCFPCLGNRAKQNKDTNRHVSKRTFYFLFHQRIHLCQGTEQILSASSHFCINQKHMGSNTSCHFPVTDLKGAAIVVSVWLDTQHMVSLDWKHPS